MYFYLDFFQIYLKKTCVFRFKSIAIYSINKTLSVLFTLKML